MNTAAFRDFDRRACAGERLTVVFFGASLTWGANATDPQTTSYRAGVARSLEDEYPKASFRFFDAAIGGTGSQLGVFRLERDVLRRKPDLVFLDFSANDNIHTDDPETLGSYEAIVRRLIEAKIPVVQVVFPFKPDAMAGDTSAMKRLHAHLEIADAYGAAAGDAISLIQRRIAEGETSADRLWPFDGGHPCDLGYDLFAEAAWEGFRQGVDQGLVGRAPEQTIHPSTYLRSVRARLSTLVLLPDGWQRGTPNLTSAFFDMLMSRWLDDEVVATSSAPLRIGFRGSMALLFGESTPLSGRFRALIDDRPSEQTNCDVPGEFDAGWLGVSARGNGHLAVVVAQGLDPEVDHTLEIFPLIAPKSGQEIRIESLCVAGPNAAVSRLSA